MFLETEVSPIFAVQTVARSLLNRDLAYQTSIFYLYAPLISGRLLAFKLERKPGDNSSSLLIPIYISAVCSISITNNLNP